MKSSSTIQEIILLLNEFWNKQGCILMNPYDVETGAGTMNPMTTLRAIGPEEWNVAYVEPSRRPADGRYGENPNRLYQHHQYQVILKPSPDNVEELYLASLEALGINPLDHDIRFVEDNWEAPTLGAWGLGWEIWLDGMEVTQFTYFQQVGGIECQPVSAELLMESKESLLIFRMLKTFLTSNIRKESVTLQFSGNRNSNIQNILLKLLTQN